MNTDGKDASLFRTWCRETLEDVHIELFLPLLSSQIWGLFHLNRMARNVLLKYCLCVWSWNGIIKMKSGDFIQRTISLYHVKHFILSIPCLVFYGHFLVYIIKTKGKTKHSCKEKKIRSTTVIKHVSTFTLNAHNMVLVHMFLYYRKITEVYFCSHFFYNSLIGKD